MKKEVVASNEFPKEFKELTRKIRTKAKKK
jgi:hypothetical protein